MKVAELVNRACLTAHMLRHYGRIGLLPVADRGESGQRDHDATILVWIGSLGRLRTSGMPVWDMPPYARPRTRGATTEPDGRTLRDATRDKARAHIAELQAASKSATRASPATSAPKGEP